MPLIELSRHYPATPEETYDALVYAVQAMAKPRSADSFSRTVSFATRMTGFASGANCSASIRPDGDGVTVIVEGQAKMRSQVNADNAAHKQLEQLLDYVSTVVQHNRQHRPQT